MRITHNVIQDRWMADVQRRLNMVDVYTRRIGSGKKIEVAADDPSGANRVLQIDEVIKRNEQYLANINEAVQFNATTETALSDVYSRLTRVKELSIEASNEASQPFGTYVAFSEEVKGIKTALQDLALTKTNGRYLFNGTAGESAPYGTNGGDYLGDRNMLNMNLGSNQKVALNLTGDRAFRETEIRSDMALFEGGAAVTFGAGESLSFTLSDGLGVDTNITLIDPAAGGPPAGYDAAARPPRSTPRLLPAGPTSRQAP